MTTIYSGDRPQNTVIETRTDRHGNVCEIHGRGEGFAIKYKGSRTFWKKRGSHSCIFASIVACRSRIDAN